ncbi:purine-nucleoside phosphorylase [Sporolactobacillus terrae]|uniref:Purine nucleoside phosphorylase n=1 Tax=Sporolactobacillus terrae TaxID=269673 RepID=A0A410D955_9BACL|nr:purine-nucleoside phosphorylase [Sporolactobacillus terrae]QAA22657.1 purine-nucleoside phosphorylase [Sporolactobacillus terrae]QAA25631.1 purine-nucleoside phosphorylase [Sporolactobacillus terrae]UAK17441.1 purine-nucleoside phosphorylase [Sporolactobacillus terrae]BBN98987.1 purine nucleoside phosphorylase [Sporolactobacillus terrae]
MKTIEEVIMKVREATAYKPTIGLILGSGLGDLADQLHQAVRIPYRSLPHFPESTVKGHKGQFVIGELEDKIVVAMQGRYHHYEGYSLAQVAFPVYVMKAMGVKQLIVTNACGGINTEFNPGDLMLITDHINMLGDSPLIGANDEALGPRFPDMSHAYSPRLIQTAKELAEQRNIEVREGVYLATHGPQYETPAEIRMMRVMGADAVGMSTVPEVIAASHLGLEVLGISCITNMACGILDQPLSHKEVIETADRVRNDFTALIQSLIRSI